MRAYILVCSLSMANSFAPASFTKPAYARVSFVKTNPPRILHDSTTNGIIQSSSQRSQTSLQASNNSSNHLVPARRSRFAFELKTFLRVLFPAVASGAAAFLALPALCFRVANFVHRTTDPGNIGMLSDAVQSFISLVGLLYSILMGQVFGFLYSQQEVS